MTPNPTNQTWLRELATKLTANEQREADNHRDYLRLGAALTLNLTVADIGAVLSLLMDHGYEIEVNLAAPTTDNHT